MPLESSVDVLIIGAGPAGLMCANALAMAGTSIRIVDKRPVGVSAGQGDRVSSRTIEILQSYGLAERFIREGTHVHLDTFYNPGRNGGIERTGCNRTVIDPTARYPFLITLPQLGVETIFLDSLECYGIEVEYLRQPSALEISEDADELSSSSTYPMKVTIKHLDAAGDEHKTEIIHAKFVVGADGAHSWVRRTLGIQMDGERTKSIWGVVDVTPETNFPDIRNVAVIHSEDGSCRCLIVPREADKNRFYIQLSGADSLDSPLTGTIGIETSPQNLFSVVREMLRPYEMTATNIERSAIYAVEQRVASSYSVKDRVFIAGDACHTHSPKAGQGLNISMNDIHNLAWKLVQVLRGWSRPSLLKTYEHERRTFAQDLVNFDKEFTVLFSRRPGATEIDGATHERLMRAIQTSDRFASGIGIQYNASSILQPKNQKYAENLIIGQRMHPQIFVRAADIHPVNIQDLLPGDVRFKVLFFVGKLTSTRITELNLLAEELSKPSSFFHTYSVDGNVSTIFEVVTIVAGRKGDMEHLLVPAFFCSHWSKVLLDDSDATESRGGHAYEKFGIDPEQITLVVIRPDGYVGAVAPSNAIADLESYFGSFMVPCGARAAPDLDIALVGLKDTESCDV